MSGFSYCVVSSVLHDKEAVDVIFARYRPLLEKAGGRRTDLAAPEGRSVSDGISPAIPGCAEFKAAPAFFFILTGGTEGIVRGTLVARRAIERREPVFLLAHPGHNSLPAALEILAWVRQQGGNGEIVFIRSASDPAALARIAMLSSVAEAMAALRQTRVGAIGDPSDWLIASSQKAEAIRTAWGPELVPIPISSLQEKMEALEPGLRTGHDGDGGGQGRIDDFLNAATSVREAQRADMFRSNLIYEGLKSLCGEFRLDALTIRCFDLVSANGSTGCYALSQLADDGIDAGCEGDIPSILALRSLRLLTGKAAWMANPASIELNGYVTVRGEGAAACDGGAAAGKLLLAHCTVPRSLIGNYGIRSHFESGLGLAIAGTFEPAPVTLFRIGGENLEAAWVAEGQLVASPHDEGLCRTQALVEMRGSDLSALLERPLGNHLVMAPGLWKGHLLALMNFLGVRRSE